MDKLLDLLKYNAKFTSQQLAAMLNESVESVEARIKKYEDNGVIKGAGAIIDWSKVKDPGVMALIELKVTPKPETGFDDTAKIVASFDNVESVYLASSSTFDFVAFVKGANIQEVSLFVSRQLSTLDSVIATATHFVLTEYKRSGVSFINDDDDEQRSMIL